MNNVIAPLRSYLGKRTISEEDKETIFNILMSSYGLVSKTRDKREWNKELPKFLKIYLGDLTKLEDWITQIIK